MPIKGVFIGVYENDKQITLWLSLSVYLTSLFESKPLPEPLITYHQLRTQEHTKIIVLSKIRLLPIFDSV